MDAFAKLIDIIRFVVSTLGVFLTVAIVMGCGLIISLFTPLYSQAVLYILNQVSLPTDARLQQPPTAIVVLGGGLTNNQQNDIVINKYTLARLKKAKQVYQAYHLPIVVSGKESPWMRNWLKSQNIWWVVAEKNSFNTCENAKFTAENLAINNAILITDAYHMNRARRQFALNHLATLPIEAPLPQAKGWTHIASNLQHSRRASYELLAFGRDILRPQQNCKSRAS